MRQNLKAPWEKSFVGVIFLERMKLKKITSLQFLLLIETNANSYFFSILFLDKKKISPLRIF